MALNLEKLIILLIIVLIKNIKLHGQEILSNCECGTSFGLFSNRIVGGRTTLKNEYPWVAAIFDSKNRIHCGGSVITNRHVLTAGHCIYYATNPLSLYVMLGMHDSETRDGIRFNIIEYRLHPKYTVHQFHDTTDLAIVTVDRRIRFDTRVKPICLPLTVNTYDNLYASVSGWGRLMTNGASSKLLQEAKVQIVPIQRCQMTKIGPLIEPENMICGFSKSSDACQGDSGGPIFLQNLNRFEQIGVTSFGLECGSDTPAIYTPLSPFTDWIRRSTAVGAMCQDPALSNNYDSTDVESF